MEFRNKLKFLRKPSAFDSDFAAEMQFHIEERADELERSGLPRKEALRRARIEFGPQARLAEESRSAWQWTWLEDLAGDLRYAARSLRREPVFLIAAVLSLALGIGVNTAIFSMTMEFLMSQPSARDASSIAVVGLGGRSHIALPQFEFLRDSNVLPGIAGLQEESYINWRTGNESQRLFAMRATGNLFSLAGIPMQLGRGLGPDDSDAVVISHGMWQGKLAADPSIIGRSLALDGKPHTVVGVLPEDHRTLFGLGLNPDLYVPVHGSDAMVKLYVRVPDGASTEAVRERLRPVAAQLDKAFPQRYFKYADSIRIDRAGGLTKGGTQQAVPIFFAMLMAVVTLLLGIACLNVSGLLLARASSRGQELAVRASLGAGRGRLLRQLLTESLLLATAGTLAGLVLNLAITQAMNRIQLPLPFPILLRIQPDWRLLAYASAIAIASALLVGFLPAWRASRASAGDALKQSEHQVSGKLALRRGLVITQVAASIVVLTTAGLFARNLFQSMAMAPGFDLDKTLYVSVRLVPGSYEDLARKRAMLQRMHSALAVTPGVESAAATAIIPFNDDTTNGGLISTDLSGEQKRIVHHFNEVGPGYFHTLGVPVLAGREFTLGDGDAVILNESFARRAFGDVPPVGHAIRQGERERRIIGVVRDSKYAWMNDHERPALFSPHSVDSGGSRSPAVKFMVRAAVDPDTLVRPLRRAVLDLDPAATVEVKPMSRAMGMALLPSRVGAWLLGIMGILGLTLTGIGLFGLMSYSVARRTREIGLRVALGAAPSRILALVFSEGAWLTGAGLAIGLAASYFLTRPLARFLVEGLSPSDPLTYGAVSALLVAAAWLACTVPALRALRVAPSQALRYE